MAVVHGYPVEGRDFVVFSGATFEVVMRWNYRGTPVDFTGWDAWMPFSSALDKPMQELSVSNGGIELTMDGLIKLKMTPEQTTELADIDIPATRGGVLKFIYNLNLQEPSGDVIPFMRGELLVQHTVPRPDTEV